MRLAVADNGSADKKIITTMMMIAMRRTISTHPQHRQSDADEQGCDHEDDYAFVESPDVPNGAFESIMKNQRQ